MSASFHAESRTCLIKCLQQAKIYASRHVKFFLNLIKIIDILLRKMQLWRTADDVAKLCRFSGFFYFSLSQACLPFGEAQCGGSPVPGLPFGEASCGGSPVPGLPFGEAQ